MISTLKVKVIRSMKRILGVLFITLLLFGCSTHQQQKAPNVKKTTNNKTVSMKKDCVNEDGTIDVYIYGKGEKVYTPNSSWISSITYYEDSKHLVMYTQDGNEYVHSNVPESLWNDFKIADSYGSFYNKHLRGNSTYWIIGYNGNNGDMIKVHYE